MFFIIHVNLSFRISVSHNTLIYCKCFCSILNDVVLNKRVSITDQAALKDAKRSLSVMLYDFLLQHRYDELDGFVSTKLTVVATPLRVEAIVPV